MDAFVQLALIEKVRRIFSDDSRLMLSFPLLAPLTFTEADLAAIASPQTAADYAIAADFARSVNFLPRDMVASASEAMLWDVFREVLTRAEVATGDDTASEETSVSLLYHIGADGVRSESEAMKRYRQYRDAWFVAREDYTSHKLTGELDNDPEVKRRWLDIEEPALRAQMDSAMADWETLGRRSEIELALQAERASALKNPRLRWSEWSQQFNPDVDMLTETSGAQYAPTGLSPSNFSSANDWPRFNLSDGEMTRLVAEAPAEVKSVLQECTARRFDSVAFEYRSVAISRPWFRSDVLTSTIWRANDPDLVLSDGGDPAAGVCVSYPVAIVFMRNLKVVERGASTSRPFGDFRFTLDPKVFTPRRPLHLDRIRPAAPLHRPVNPATPIQRHVIGARALRRVEPAVFAAPPPPPPARRDELSILAFVCKRLPKAPDPSATLRWT